MANGATRLRVQPSTSQLLAGGCPKIKSVAAFSNPAQLAVYVDMLTRLKEAVEKARGERTLCGVIKEVIKPIKGERGEV